MDEEAYKFKVQYLHGRTGCICSRNKREGGCALPGEICRRRWRQGYGRDIVAPAGNQPENREDKLLPTCLSEGNPHREVWLNRQKSAECPGSDRIPR